MDVGFKNAKILVVDDRKENIVVLKGLLQMQGYSNIETLTDSRLFFDLFKSFKPDLIVLDLMMPYVSGFDIMKTLKELISENTYLPILVLTADITEETKQRALAEGAKDFLAKPFDLIEVSLRIENLLFTRFLHLQLENQNQILEEKVKERTFQLEKTNQELIIAKEKAEESSRLKRAFLLNINHEIRTPMNGIMGFTGLLKEGEISIENQQKYLNIISKSSVRLLHTIEDIINISMIEAGLEKVSILEVNINEQLEDIYEFFKPEANKRGLKLSLTHTLLEQDAIIKSDQIKIYSVLSNLVKNAIKFTEKGSIEFGCYLIENSLKIFIKDTGIGIPLNRQPFIFDRFVQADIEDKAVHEGSGLGLAISKSYVEMLGGQIEVESEEALGSLFSVTIPFK